MSTAEDEGHLQDRMAEVEEKVAALQQDLKEGQQKQEQLLLQQAQLESSAQPQEDEQVRCCMQVHACPARSRNIKI